MHNNWILFLTCYLQIFGEVLSLFWYFQSIQKMKIVAYIQLSFKLISLPFIFIFIKNSSDSWIYALIISTTVIFGGFFSLIYLFFEDHFRFKYQSFQSLKLYFQEALPFFWSNSTETIKQESVTIIIGTFLGMRDVALYDLANKVIMLPRLLCISINGALFPKIIENVNKNVIQKILRYETLIGLGVIAAVSLFGYWAVLILGGKTMLDSYPIAVILSLTVLVWLIVGSYISFVFVPSKKYYFVTYNQFVALISFILFCIPAAIIFHNITAIVSALTLSGFCEIIYCRYIISKNKLL
jgi:PST family polysaccharide transporter